LLLLTGLFSGISVSVYATYRQDLLPILNNYVQKYYAPTGSSVKKDAPFIQEDERAWQARWRKGEVQSWEFAFGILLAMFHSVLGYFLGNRRILSMLLGAIGTMAALVLYWVSTGFLNWSYDPFHGDIYTGALMFDLMWPMGNDPYTTISAPIYLFICLSLLIAASHSNTPAHR
jgi:hypothetical protein